MSQTQPPPPEQSEQTLRIARPKDPYSSLGAAVSYLMTKPAFARQPFGTWSRVLTRQVNRRRCIFAVTGQQVVGFIGWDVTSEQHANNWLDNNVEIPTEQDTPEEVMVINAWSADSRQINRFLLETLRKIGKDYRFCVYRRFYPDGRVRPMRLNVNDYVAQHIAAKEHEGGTTPPDTAA